MESRRQIGASFEQIAKEVISMRKGITLIQDIAIPVGVGDIKKKHKFDLGNLEQKVLVECKHHAWTDTGNSPSAKMTIWNEAMLYFMLLPKEFTNILFVKKSIHLKRSETLANYYFRIYVHLIPENVEIWEYDVETKELKIYSM